MKTNKKEVKRQVAGEKMLIRRKYLTVIFILLALLLVGCGHKDPSGKPESTAGPAQTRIKSPQRTAFLVKDQETVLVYFATPDGKNLVPVTLSINPTKEAAKVAVEKLLAGPENDFSLGIIPEGTKLKDIYLQGRTVFLDLTLNIKNVSEDKAQQVVDALVLTLTEFQEVDDVQMLIGGQVEEKLGPVEIDKPLKRPVSINCYEKPDKKPVRVYFSDANAMYLVPVTLNAQESELPLAALKKLIKGPPEKSGLLRTVWPGTKILNFSLKDRVATVDFSSEVLGYGGGAAAETMLVNSVVLTLTQFSNVEAVQFLVEGKKLEYLPEGTDVSAPIPAPQEINYIGK